jgi:acetoin utilization protein AcuB
MLVQDVMQRVVATVAPEASVREAVRLARQRGIRHVPVLDKGRLVGIVSDRDLKEVLAACAAREELGEGDPVARTRVDMIMTREVVTAAPTTLVTDAAARMLERRISALPVLDGERLVGIVTETDVLGALLAAVRGQAAAPRGGR